MIKRDHIMKNSFYAAASLLFLLTDVSYSQVTRGGEVNFDMDMATFRASEGWTYLEIYYAVQRDSISHIFTKGRFEGSLELGAQFLLGDSVAARQNFQSVDIVDSLAEIRAGQHLYNQISFYLKDGDYTLHTNINDHKRNAGGWYRQPVRISAYGRDSLNVSDIQLSTSMSADTSKDRFNKNGYRILPNASGMYGLELPVLFYYCEIYNLSGLDRSLDSNYTVHVSLQDMNQRVVKEMPSKTKKRMAGSLVEVGRLNAAGSGP